MHIASRLQAYSLVVYTAQASVVRDHLDWKRTPPPPPLASSQRGPALGQRRLRLTGREPSSYRGTWQ